MGLNNNGLWNHFRQFAVNYICVGLVSATVYFGIAPAMGTDKNISPKEKVRYAQIDFRGKMADPGMSPYDRKYIGHVHYTLTSRLPNCKAEFDGTVAGLASLVFPASCPENVPLEGLVSTHQEKCGPITYETGHSHDFYRRDKLMVKTSTSRDSPSVTTAIIGCL